jgi:phage terminase large subunit-like protein
MPPRKRRRGERITWPSIGPSPSPPSSVEQDAAPKSHAALGAASQLWTEPDLDNRAQDTVAPDLPAERAPTRTEARGGSSPARSAGPVCGQRWNDEQCERRGEHLCSPRVAHVVGFFAEVLVHTKGRWTRQAFVLAAWQVSDIIAPLFGTVVWSVEAGRYVRRYRIAWLELARKNGKSELLAGIVLYLLVADDEEGAEIYGCARDREQARKVFDVAERMVKLSAVLSKRLKIFSTAKRIVDERTGSYYEIIAADAVGNLGHNPHGVILDETISQRDGGLWSAMRTAMGARDQPLMVAATTAGDDARSFAAAEHAEMQKILDDPERAPHVFVCMRNTPADADPWDERNWKYPNPALGTFLSLQTLRDEALEARNDPSKENAFRQFRLNQWVAQASRWMPMHLWDASCGDLWLNPTWGRAKLAGRECFAGFDLSAKFDLTAWCLAFPDEDETAPVDMLWRFWLPEAGLERLDKLNDGKFSRWAKTGWLTVTEGNVIDYDRVISDIAEDAAEFRIRAANCDEWSMWPIINRVAEACGLDPENGDLTAYRNTYDRMSPGMDDVLGLVRNRQLAHHGNPIAWFCFDACKVRRAPYDPNLMRPAKPERNIDRERIDAVPTAAMAANAMRGIAAGPMRVSAYEESGLMVI